MVLHSNNLNVREVRFGQGNVLPTRIGVSLTNLSKDCMPEEQFGVSSHIADLHSLAPTTAIRLALRTLLGCIGEVNEALIDILAEPAAKNEVLYEIRDWGAKLAPHPARDRIGREATKFWVAQTLATTVLRSGALKQESAANRHVAQIMEIGADGLFETGRAQFERLASLAHEILEWISQQGFAKVALVESPLGNSLAVQVLSDLGSKMNVSLTPKVWNAPRNDRPAAGWTIRQAAKLFADETTEFDLIVYVDDAITGSRFIKLYDALLRSVGEKRFLPVAMVFDDPTKAHDEGTRKRLEGRLNSQKEKMDAPFAWVTFPRLRIFHVDGGKPCHWQTPVIWGESDLVAGKRKVNLVFTLLDHIFRIIEDLGKQQSVFRPVLEQAWSENTSGEKFAHEQGLQERIFKSIADQLSLVSLKKRMWGLAKEEFPADYAGTLTGMEDEDVRRRWDWIRETS